MKKLIISIGVLAAGAALMAGCGSIFDSDDAVVVNPEQCWVEIHEDANFIRDTAWTRIQGPTELDKITELAGYDWNDKISSLRVGPDAIVQVSEHAGFNGEVREYRYGRYVEDLTDDGMNDRISAIKIRCR